MSEFNRKDNEDSEDGEENKRPLLPRDYEITFTDGSKTFVSGMLGVNDIFAAIVDPSNRLIFAAPLGTVHHCLARPESILGSRVPN